MNMHAYETGPRKDKRGFDLISDVLTIPSAVVRRAERSRERNRIRQVLQPLT
jgi:hypothetical protein